MMHEILDDGESQTHCKVIHQWSNTTKPGIVVISFISQHQDKQNNTLNNSISNKKKKSGVEQRISEPDYGVLDLEKHSKKC